MYALLLYAATIASEVDDVLTSLRSALRQKYAALRAVRRSAAVEMAPGRRLSSTSGDLCSDGDCRIDSTTGIAGWMGASATPREYHWAEVSRGSWIGGSSQSAPSFFVASVSFHIAEPSCASFDLAFSADARVVSVQLNGRPLAVPAHSFRSHPPLSNQPSLLFTAHHTNDLCSPSRVCAAFNGACLAFHRLFSDRLLAVLMTLPGG